LIIVGIFIPALYLASTIQIQRREHLFNPSKKTTAQNFKGAEQFLDAMHIPKEAKILVLGVDGPNNPFVLMNRKGYCVLSSEPERIEMGLNWPYDFVVLENSEMLNGIYNQYPQIINRLTKLASNGSITIYTKNEQNVSQDLESFFSLSLKKIKYHQLISFDSIPENCFNVDSLSSFAYSGKKSGFVSPENEYGFTHRIYNLGSLNKLNGELVIKAVFAAQNIPLNELLLTVSIKAKDKDILFSTVDLSKHINDKQWIKREFIYSLPQIEEKEFEIGIFIWNRGKNTVFYDDFDITIY